MKKSSVFEWHRRFKEGREDVQDDPRSGQPKTQRTDANMDRVRTLVHSDQILGVRVTAEELNMNRETVRQIVKKIWEWENFPLKWWLESWHMARNNVGFTFHLIFYAMHRCLIGSLPVMKRGVFNTTRKQNDRACSGKHRIHLGRKKASMSRSQVKTMLVCFFDHKVIVRYEFIAKGQTVNQQCHWKCWQGYGNLFGGKDPDSGLISGFSTMTMPLCMMR